MTRRTTDPKNSTVVTSIFATGSTGLAWLNTETGDLFAPRALAYRAIDRRDVAKIVEDGGELYWSRLLCPSSAQKATLTPNQPNTAA